jgi:hypothetical protein
LDETCLLQRALTGARLRRTAGAAFELIITAGVAEFAHKRCRGADLSFA